MSLAQHMFVLLIVVGLAYATCEDCDDETQTCVEDGESSYCECRPSLYLVEEECIKTKSYSTEVVLVEGAYGVEQWTEELTDQDSETFLNLSRSICDAFDGVLSSSNNNTYKADYYGCEIVGFFEGSVGAIVLSFYQELTDITSSDLEGILGEGLPDTFVTSSLATKAANECELLLDDCDPYLGNCTDTGAEGYECVCSGASEDVTSAVLMGRNCTLSDPNWNIVYISAGTSVGVFILLLVLVVCMSQFAVPGSSISETEKQKSEKHSSEKDKKSDVNDKRHLQPERNEDDNRGAVNTGFETTEDQSTPENIFDVGEEQMARLAHIHSIIANHHNRPASLHIPSAQTSNQLPLERVPSVDYGPDYRPSSAVYQNSRQYQRNGKPNLVRLPSGEYLEPIANIQRSPTRQNSSRTPSRPTSYNFGDESASSGIYATRFPSFTGKTPTSPTPSEPHLSRQSSSVFLPSSPRHSRNLSNTSTVYYNK